MEASQAEGRRKEEGRGWAGLGRKAEQSEPVPRKRSAGHKEDAGRNVNGLQKLFSILNMVFDSKSKGSNAFELNLELKPH
jgi:hypothetical protein